MLALGARVALLPGLFLCALFIVVQWKRRSLLLIFAWIVGGLALASYNYYRFDSPFNFGFTYQLSTQPNSTPGVVSLQHLGPNLLFHSLAPVQLEPRFPFVITQPKPWHEKIPHQEQFVIAQPIVGLIWSAPYFCFLPASLLWLRRARLRGWYLPLLTALGAGLPALMIYNPAIRYQLDFSLIGLALSGTGYIYFCQRRPRLGKLLAVGIAAWTIVFGSFWGASGESDHFKQSNPHLYAKLRGQP